MSELASIEVESEHGVSLEIERLVVDEEPVGMTVDVA